LEIDLQRTKQISVDNLVSNLKQDEQDKITKAERKRMQYKRLEEFLASYSNHVESGWRSIEYYHLSLTAIQGLRSSLHAVYTITLRAVEPMMPVT
jgi:hypothetical protein